MKNVKLHNLIIFSFLLILLNSCSNFFGKNDDSTSKNYTISGNVITQIIPSAERTAYPTYAGTNASANIYYTITATCGLDTVTTECTTDSSSFSLKLPKLGNWNVSAEGFQDEAKTKKVLETKSTKELFINGEHPGGYVDLVLMPVATAGGYGTINLKMQHTGTIRTVTLVTVNCISADNDEEKDYFNDAILNSGLVPASKQTSIVIYVPSGSYTVEINFYDASNTLLYNTTEVINVYDIILTNKWVKTGEEEYINDNGQFIVTDAMTERFIQNTIYVDGTDGNDSNSGTWLTPVKTFDKAIDLYSAAGSNVSKIFINGEVSASKNIEINRDLEIRKQPGAENAIISYAAGTSISDFLFKLSSSNRLTVSGIKITGENVSGFSKAAMYVPSTSELIFENSEIYKIKNNVLNSYGGAIFVSGTVLFRNSKITECELTSESSDGAAIGVTGSSSVLKMEGVNVIKNNKKNGAENNIYLADGKYITVTGNLEGSEIGVTCENESSINTGLMQQIQITSGYSVFNTVGPNRVFISDAGYSTGKFDDEAVLAATSGYITPVMGAGYQLTLQNRLISKDGIIIKITKDGVDLGELDDRAISYNWNLRRNGAVVEPYNGGEITGTYPTSGSWKMMWPQYFENFEPGTYILNIYFDYIGKESETIAYSTSWEVYIGPDDVIPLLSYMEEEDKIPDTPGKYGIYSKDDLEELSRMVRGYWENFHGEIQDASNLAGMEFVLCDDIDLMNTSSNDWYPIGLYFDTLEDCCEFNGTFDGNGHKITNIYMGSGHNENYDLGKYTGLFGYIGNDGLVKNLSLYGILGDGGIAGYNAGTIENCRNYATLTPAKDGNYCGGIACESKGDIENCVNYADFTLPSTYQYCAGIVAKTTGGMITNCENRGKIIAYSRVAGIVVDSKSSIINCKNYGDLETTHPGTISEFGRCAGIVSEMNGNANITACINYGNINSGDYIAGIVGNMSNSASSSTIDKCINYGNIESNGFGKGDSYTKGKVAGIVGMAQNSSYCVIRNCMNFGDLKGAFNVAGIAGHNSPTIENCLNTGNVEASRNYNTYSAGIAGSGEKVKNCISIGKVSISDATAPLAAISGYGFDTVLNNYYLPDVHMGDEMGYGVIPTHKDEEGGHTDPIYFEWNSEKGNSYATESEITIAGTISGATKTVVSTDVVDLLNAWIEKQTRQTDYQYWKYNEKGIPVLTDDTDITVPWN